MKRLILATVLLLATAGPALATDPSPPPFPPVIHDESTFEFCDPAIYVECQPWIAPPGWVPPTETVIVPASSPVMLPDTAMVTP